MPSYILLFVVVLVGLSIIDFLISKEKNTPVNKRKRQFNNLLTENVIKEKLTKQIESRVKVSKKLKIEEKLSQAGLRMDFADYMMLSILSAIVFALFFGLALSNPLLSVISLIMGYFIPGQVIEILKNKRISKLEKQIGSFMHMVTKRYENTKDFHKSLALTVPEFEGEEPMYSEVKKTLAEMNLGVESSVALKNFSKRTNNKFMIRYAAFYELVSNIGKDDMRKDLLGQAIKQYEEDYRLKRTLKKEISGPVTEAYMMLAFVPIIAIYQASTNSDYIYIMTQTGMGRMGTAGVMTVLIITTWFINTKLGAPLD